MSRLGQCAQRRTNITQDCRQIDRRTRAAHMAAVRAGQKEQVGDEGAEAVNLFEAN